MFEQLIKYSPEGVVKSDVIVTENHCCLRALGTHYRATLDPAVLWTLSNDTSRSICSDSINLMPPAPLYLWRYTNAVIIILWTQIHGAAASHFSLPRNQRTRGHPYKIYRQPCRLNVSLYSFANRISDIWNNLPFEIVCVSSSAAFKKSSTLLILRLSF